MSTEADKITKPEKVAGFDSPLPRSVKSLPDHIAADTRMAKGIAPDSKEIITVNLSVLQAQHGKEAGLDRYKRIAVAGGFYDPNSEPSGSDFYPDLSLTGMDKKHRDAVNEILNEKES